jgi:hypothetical protein
MLLQAPYQDANSLSFCFIEAPLDILPTDDIPPFVDISGSVILVLQIICSPTCDADPASCRDGKMAGLLSPSTSARRHARRIQAFTPTTKAMQSLVAPGNFMDSIATASAYIDIGKSQVPPAFRKGCNGIVVTPLEKRLKAYELFQELSARDKSTREMVCTISRRFGVSQSAVYAWTNGVSPFGRRCGRITYTKELFYVIGALLGDGCIYFWKNGYQISLLGEREFCVKYAERVSACTSHRKAKTYP